MVNDQTPLRGPPWTFEDIGATGVIDNSLAMLMFMLDGRSAGRATCNRILGSDVRNSTALTIRKFGITRMACPEALRHRERPLMDLPQAITGYRIDGTGTLLLHAEDGKTIKARRQAPVVRISAHRGRCFRLIVDGISA